ncbi:MAG TPA: hypothetical protein VNL39_00520 [Xanthobacteraceae bacterium]|nr:hypothetical protein [Xanthobacteraceae bacterium]
MDLIRRIAFETTLRGCGFGFLAIFIIMVGLSYWPGHAFRAGGILMLLMTAILLLKAREALRKPYRSTEMWLYVPKDHRFPEAYAQWAFSTVLNETYLQFAYWTSAISVVMWILTLGFSVAGL